MADDLKIEINDAAALVILKSPEVQEELVRRGNAIAAAAGSGSIGEYEVTPSMTPTRARVSIVTADHGARYAEATARTLSSALDAGRG